MKIILFIGRFVVLYLMMVLAGFIANLAYHGSFQVASWSATGRGWMVFAPLVAVVIFFIMEMFEAFEER
jgi:hypothetical protein